MIKEAIDKIIEITKPELLKDEWGRLWATKNLVDISQPKATHLVVETLSGFVDYVKEVVQKKEIFILVESAKSVRCYGIDEVLPSRHREYYASANYQFSGFYFGQWMNLEDFIIGIQVMFQQDNNTAAILKIVGNLSDNTVTTFQDDGVSQSVQAKTSLTKVENVALPRMIELAPWRTFREIEQPKSKFIFRMRQQKEQPPACALFDVGGDLWKIEAMQRIKEYLEAALPDILVIA